MMSESIEYVIDYPIEFTIMLFMIFVLMGCGRGVAGPPASHGVFEKYFQSFEDASHRQGRDTFGDSSVPIVFESIGFNGQCKVDPISGRSISIDPTIWYTLNELEREMLVWHELGHCVMNRIHIVSFDQLSDNSWIPTSIMLPYLFQSVMYDENKAYYEYELFHNVNEGDTFNTGF